MKKTILLVLAIAFGFTACEDDDLRNADVPSVVLNGFIAQFPKATGVEWEKKANLYEAEFELDKVEYEAILDQEGSILKYKYEVTYEDLPEAVKETITKEFDKAGIEEAEVLRIAESTYFQIEFDAAPNDFDIIFEESGEITTNIPIW